MTGVIWLVQIVHYPLLIYGDQANYGSYHRKNDQLTAWVVGPPMLLEFCSAVALAVKACGFATILGVVLLAVIWLSTFFLQVPCHQRLEKGFDAETHRKLVRTNWIRTIAWTARAVLALWMVGRT